MKRFFALLLLGALLVGCLAGCSDDGTSAYLQRDGEKYITKDWLPDGYVVVKQKNGDLDEASASLRSVKGTYVANVDLMSIYEKQNNTKTAASLDMKVVIHLDGEGGVVMYAEIDEDEFVDAMIQLYAEDDGVSFVEAKRGLIADYGDEQAMKRYILGRSNLSEIPTRKAPDHGSYTVDGATLEIIDEDGEASEYEIVGDTLCLEKLGVYIAFKRQ